METRELEVRSDNGHEDARKRNTELRDNDHRDDRSRGYYENVATEGDNGHLPKHPYAHPPPRGGYSHVLPPRHVGYPVPPPYGAGPHPYAYPPPPYGYPYPPPYPMPYPPYPPMQRPPHPPPWSGNRSPGRQYSPDSHHQVREDRLDHSGPNSRDLRSSGEDNSRKRRRDSEDATQSPLRKSSKLSHSGNGPHECVQYEGEMDTETEDKFVPAPSTQLPSQAPATPTSSNVRLSQDRGNYHPPHDRSYPSQDRGHPPQDRSGYPSQDRSNLASSQDRGSYPPAQERGNYPPSQDRGNLGSSQDRGSHLPPYERGNTHPLSPSHDRGNLASSQDRSNLPSAPHNDSHLEKPHVERTSTFNRESSNSNASTFLSASQGSSAPPSSSTYSNLSSSAGSAPSTPSKSSQNSLSLSLLGVRGAPKKTEELVSSLNKYWSNLDLHRSKLTKIRRERLQIDKQENAIEFEVIKTEYKLEQANRRLGVVIADLEETDHQIQCLSEDGVFPPSIWHMEVQSVKSATLQPQEPVPSKEPSVALSQSQEQTQ